jgi:hypothetical protein
VNSWPRAWSLIVTGSPRCTIGSSSSRATRGSSRPLASRQIQRTLMCSPLGLGRLEELARRRFAVALPHVGDATRQRAAERLRLPPA